MILLSLMNMELIQDLYNFSACTINFHRIKEMISNARTLYSERSVSIVEGLLK